VFKSPGAHRLTCRLAIRRHRSVGLAAEIAATHARIDPDAGVGMAAIEPISGERQGKRSSRQVVDQAELIAERVCHDRPLQPRLFIWVSTLCLDHDPTESEDFLDRSTDIVDAEV